MTQANAEWDQLQNPLKFISVTAVKTGGRNSIPKRNKYRKLDNARKNIPLHSSIGLKASSNTTILLCANLINVSQL